MVVSSKDYLLKIVRNYNKIDQIGEQWEGIREELENEQANLINQWLNNQIESEVAKARIWSMKWLLDFVSRSTRQGQDAIKKLKGVD